MYDFDCNAKKELLNISQDIIDKFKCAEIKFEDKVIILPIDYTKEQYNLFLSELDFTYDDDLLVSEERNEYNLQGTIWLTDGGWMTRGENTMYEVWQLHPAAPTIPDHLL